MYLKDVENHVSSHPRTQENQQLRLAGIPMPQIRYLLAFKPEQTIHLDRYTQAVMRGPSPLSPGQRELIAALTSRVHDCAF
jgi:alkylhydroperoxidase family enzyme